jgi:aminopeptidase-like protein
LTYRDDLASEIAEYFDRLWPLMRSITGKGVRETHDILGELVPLERHEIPSGTKVLDWTVPAEWVVREAYVVEPSGRRLLDIADNTLNVVNYSTSFRGTLSRAELDKHLHSLPDQPDAIPYLTSYYNPYWGFCLPHRLRQSLPEGDYKVVVDTDHIQGSLTISDSVLPGDQPDEVLLSTYTCHPSMANNELSGPLVTAFLYKRLAAWPRRRLTYRFVFLPETIGSITYLSMHGAEFRERLRAGYVLTCIGNDQPFTLKRSRRGDTVADRAAEYILGQREGTRFVDFFPDGGSDERQYCSPGFNLPVASIMRSMYATYPEYHTSLDNKAFVDFDAMADAVLTCEEVMRTIEQTASYRNLLPFGEPQLGRRGLYLGLGAQKTKSDLQSAVMWTLSYSDGANDLLEIARRSGISVARLADAAARLVRAGLIEGCEL